MTFSPFHALYKARTLANYTYGSDKLIPAYASADIKIYPYQIAAAMFALRSPYQKGVILCDDGSLGKSYESLLIITQKWYEGKQKILVIVPTQLLHQWLKIINANFAIPCVSIDNNNVWGEYLKAGLENPFKQESVVITTYDFAADKAEFVEQISWDLSVFDEAHRLRRIYTGENKRAFALKKALAGSFKILLTATPLQNSILDLYGLINFIDENVFTDEKTFYSRYFRRPELYGELALRISKYCFRTMRHQVESYVKIPERLPITIEYSLTDKEQKLYDLLDKYLQKPIKKAFPKMDKYELSLMMFRTFSSSVFAFKETLSKVAQRLENETKKDTASQNNELLRELKEITTMLALAESIKETAKGRKLLTALDIGFKETKKLGAKNKALIFTENRATQKYLYDLLNNGKYKGKVIIFNGDKSRDYTIMEQFAGQMQILISTDLAAEGFNLEFCSFVINYDMPYNTLKIEQRITRCHRQGQNCAVVVTNFLNKNNFADVRLLELINKRLLQFDGIFGISDDTLGNFSSSLEKSFGKILATARTKDEIDQAFNEILTEHETENKKLVKNAQVSLYSSFDKQISDKVTVLPQYYKDMVKKVNDDLWQLTKFFFAGESDYQCFDDTRTVRILLNPKKVFTGARLGRREYSMIDKSLPKSAWHTITGTLAKNIIAEIFWRGVPDKGTISVDGLPEDCSIGYYEIKVKSKEHFMDSWEYYVFVGKTKSGRLLSDDECREIMELPVAGFTQKGELYGERDGISKSKNREELDDLAENLRHNYFEKTLAQINPACREEIEKLKAYANDKKIGLERNLAALKNELNLADSQIFKSDVISDKLKAEKQKSGIQRELKKAEQNIFLEKLRLDAEVEDQIKRMTEGLNLTSEIKRQFIIQVMSA